MDVCVNADISGMCYYFTNVDRAKRNGLTVYDDGYCINAECEECKKYDPVSTKE